MQYRKARLLKTGDQVALKSDPNIILLVMSIECYGQHKRVKINCTDLYSKTVSVFNDEVE